MRGLKGWVVEMSSFGPPRKRSARRLGMTWIRTSAEPGDPNAWEGRGAGATCYARWRVEQPSDNRGRRLQGVILMFKTGILEVMPRNAHKEGSHG
jgi:hypothetical protein